MSEGALARLAGICGIAAIVLLLGANAQLGTTPLPEDSPEKVLDFLSNKRSQTLVFVALFAVAYLLLIIFGAGLRQVLRRAGDTTGLPDLVLAASVWINATDSSAWPQSVLPRFEPQTSKPRPLRS